MKYFAELNESNVVVNIFVNDNTIEELNQDLELPEFHKIVEYSNDNSTVTNNPATIGSTYNENLNAFIPEQENPTYILNTETFEWEPNENLKYDLHNNGDLYRYCKISNGWIPTWECKNTD